MQDGTVLHEGGLNHKAIQFSENENLSIDNDNMNLLIPSQFQLISIYPNPFNPVATIIYELPRITLLDIKVYDIKGQQVADLYNGMQSAGVHKLIWDASNYSSGIYFIKISDSRIHLTQKIVLIK